MASVAILARVTALAAIVSAVAPVTSPVCVAFDTFALLAVTSDARVDPARVAGTIARVVSVPVATSPC